MKVQGISTVMYVHGAAKQNVKLSGKPLKKTLKPITEIVSVATVVMDEKVKQAYENDPDFRCRINKYLETKHGKIKLETGEAYSDDFLGSDKVTRAVYAFEIFDDGLCGEKERIGGIHYSEQNPDYIKGDFAPEWYKFHWSGRN